MQKSSKYPIILKELVVNCWAQEYAARPSAQEITSILQSPDCLQLLNAYNSELLSNTVSVALVVTVDDHQSVWLAHSSEDQYKVTVYEFVEATTDSSVQMVKVNIQIYLYILDMALSQNLNG